jgi:hypothetical protein
MVDFLQAGEATMNARIGLLFAATAFQASTLFTASVGFAASVGSSTVLTDPAPLPPGATVSPIPNGYSFDSSDPTTAIFSTTEDFDFTGEGGPSGFLFEAIYSLPDESSAHPYGPGLFFIYNVVLSSGDVTSLSVPGYSGYQVSVKQCGISGCIDYGSNGATMTSASRTSDGDTISFDFDLSGPGNSSNLQLFTNASFFVDPFGTLTDSEGGTFSIPVVTPSAIPEPSTWAMMFIGFAALGVFGLWPGRLLRA